MSTVPPLSELSERMTTVTMLMAAMIMCFIYMLARNAGLLVVVPDEWLYSKSARLVSLESVQLPSYLYFLIYRTTNFCGSGFGECARWINSLFLVGAMPFIYMLCRRVGSRRVALFVALLAVLGPINAYTARFMPETLYFMMFWVFAWYTLRPAEVEPVVYGVSMGVIVALMGLVKAHAVFLVPAIIGFVVFRYFWLGSDQPLRKSLLALSGFFSAALLIRFGLGYFFAGSAGLDIFGQTYGSIAPSTADAERYTRLVSPALVSLKGHAMALSVLFALPLAALFYFPTRNTAHGGAVIASREIRLFTFFVLSCLLVMTTLFSATVAGSNDMETIARLHMRYYNFALPLLLIIAAEHVGPAPSRQIYRALPPVIVFAILAILSITSLLEFYTPGFFDSPELWGITVNQVVFRVIVVLGVLSLIAWLVDTRLGARVFLFGVFPLVVAVSGWRVNAQVRLNMQPDRYAQAGMFAHQYLGDKQEPIIVVGSEHSSLFRTMFYLDNPNAEKLVLPSFEPIAESSVPADTKWLLVVGSHSLPKNARREAGFGGFALARMGSNEGLQEIDFTQGSWPGVNAAGLSGPEPWGTWSDGKRVALEFSNPLPREFTLILKGHTIGNTDQPSTIMVGHQQREIRLPSPQELALAFSTDGSVHTINFDIPWARPLKELGIVSEDTRRLGIGFVSIRIIGNTPGDATNAQ